MNVRMWQHAATRRNIATLRGGACFVGPDGGAMACGEVGPGRMAEPAAIFEAIMAAAAPAPGLAGKRAIVTSRPQPRGDRPGADHPQTAPPASQGHAIAGRAGRPGRGGACWFAARLPSPAPFWACAQPMSNPHGEMLGGVPRRTSRRRSHGVCSPRRVSDGDRAGHQRHFGAEPRQGVAMAWPCLPEEWLEM